MTDTPKIAPYGTWASTITTDTVVEAGTGLGAARFDNGDIYWLEGRPQEGGRNVIVRLSQDAAKLGAAAVDVTPAPHNVRSRVHEYGGGAYTVAQGVVAFVDAADQRIHLQHPGNGPRPLTPEPPDPAAWRYADLVVDSARQRILCVREDHTATPEPANALVAVAMATGNVTVLDEGRDFYAAPRLSRDGTKLAWLAWDHPNMPWDGTDLFTADIDTAGALSNKRHVAGGPDTAVVQPLWSPAGVLHFVSDATEWWNIYALGDAGAATPVTAMQAEFGGPMWVFGQASYDFMPDGSILCAYTRDGGRILARVANGTVTDLEARFAAVGSICTHDDGSAVFLTASPDGPPAVIRRDPAGDLQVLCVTSDNPVDPGLISRAQAISFPTTGGASGPATAHAFYYPPLNPAYAAPDGERSPLIVRTHGGPTGATSPALSLAIQFWTSRGFAVVDVDYRGSTGYGRPYRDALRGQWGVVDVEDCVAAATYLVDQGKADPDRLVIRGGSAGGYTTLAALAFHDTFAAGASLYGIGDLMTLAADTHKFESRYTDRLVGPLPETEQLYRDRSPINHVDGLNCPVIFLQGMQDKVVPPNQAEAMVAALEHKGVPVAYLTFENEGHGFRDGVNVRRALEAELYFYCRVFGVEPADPIDPVPIRNLD